MKTATRHHFLMPGLIIYHPRHSIRIHHSYKSILGVSVGRNEKNKKSPRKVQNSQLFCLQNSRKHNWAAMNGKHEGRLMSEGQSVELKEHLHNIKNMKKVNLFSLFNKKM